MSAEYKDDNNVASSSVASNSGADAGSITPIQGGESQNQDTQGAPATTPTSGSGKPDAPQLSDVVHRALGGEGNSSDPASKKDGAQKPETGTNPDGTKKDGADPKNPVDEQLNNHPRFREVIAQKNELKKQVDTLQGQLTDYQNITSFMSNQNLSGDDVTKGFEIMALMKSDPIKALELLSPYITQLQQIAGDILPPEIQARVDAGELLPADAQRLVRSQNQTAIIANRERQMRERFQQTAQDAEFRQTTEAVNGALGAWEERMRKIDPNYAQVEPFFLEAIRNAFSSKLPRTPQDAVDDAKRIYEGVSNRLRKMLPARHGIAPLPSSTASSNTASAQPETALAAVQLALRQGK